MNRAYWRANEQQIFEFICNAYEPVYIKWILRIVGT